MGWSNPEGESPNYHRKWDLRTDGELRELAVYALRTLSEAFGWKPADGVEARVYLH
jgi:hypothetical protein